MMMCPLVAENHWMQLWLWERVKLFTALLLWRKQIYLNQHRHVVVGHRMYIKCLMVQIISIMICKTNAAQAQVYNIWLVIG